MTETTIQALQYGSYHLPYDPEQHVAAYGARLIYNEVADGGKGVVYDRQAFIGDDAFFKPVILPALDKWYAMIQENIRDYQITSASEEIYFLDDEGPGGDKVRVVGSPQGSYGYLYVTVAVFK